MRFSSFYTLAVVLATTSATVNAASGGASSSSGAPSKFKANPQSDIAAASHLHAQAKANPASAILKTGASVASRVAGASIRRPPGASRSASRVRAKTKLPTSPLKKGSK